MLGNHKDTKNIRQSADNQLFISKNFKTSSKNFLQREGHDVITDEVIASEANNIITDFEEKLSQQNVLCFLISDDFLRSEHCMYELYYNYIENRQSIRNMVQQIIPLWIEGTKLNDESIIIISQYWENKKKCFNKMFQQLNDIDRKTIAERLTRIERIHNKSVEIMSNLKNINMIKVNTNNIPSCFSELNKRIETII